MIRPLILGTGLLIALAIVGCTGGQAGREPAEVTEYAMGWPDLGDPPRNGCDPLEPGETAHAGSTHEITFDPRRPGDLWISGQNYDWLGRITPGSEARRFVHMPAGSGPHGLEFDSQGRLWATLECAGKLVALDLNDKVVVTVALARGTRPHGLGIAPDGRTLWYTGKTDGTIGRVAPDGIVTRFALADPKSTPIYVKAGPGGAMWATELTGNRIARITADDKLTEFPIPTADSRPIAIVPGPDGAMWFSEERGGKVGRIDAEGRIAEFPVPKPDGRPNLILAGLAFDSEGDLWVQQYVDPNRPEPAGDDYLVRIDKAGLAAGPEGLQAAHFTHRRVPTRSTVMHRIIEGPDGAMWFTEMHADKLGRAAR
jgi:virginiamycin B lyase